MLKNWSTQKKIRFIFCEIALLFMLFFMGVVSVFAQVNDPVFTNTFAQDLAGVVTDPGDIVNIGGQNYYVATTTQAVAGCVGTERIGSMQWYGSTWAYVGGGSSVSCPGNNNFYDVGEPILINLLTEVDGFYCAIKGTTTPNIEPNIANRLCVEIANSQPPVLYDPDNLQDNIIDPDNPQLNFQTRFIDGVASGVSSTTVQFDIDYFLETSEYTANTRPDMVQVQVSDDTRQVAINRKLILPLSDGQFSVTVPSEYIAFPGGYPDGTYYAYVNFWNINIDSFVFSEATLLIEFVISGGAVISSQVVDNFTGEQLEDIRYVNCSITNLSGCFQNALIYVFVPQPDTFNRFVTLYERIENKAPFGYVSSLNNELQNLTNATTSAFTFGAIPFVNDIFDPFRTLLVFGLWAIYALFFMGRLDKLDI